MNDKKLETWFFMRPGFSTFRLEPDKHRQYLFGERDRRQRDLVLGSIEEACYTKEGHKTAVYGDYGRGKTHQCFNIIYEVQRRNFPVIPIYIKCSAYKSKEPFYSLFKEMVLRQSTADLNRVATEYQRRVNNREARPLIDIVYFEDIATVMSKGLSAVETDVIKNSMRWLGGEPKVPMGLISKALQPQLTDSREFGAVLRGIAHMYSEVDGKVPLYLVDEAERFQNVTNPDAYYTWLASLRDITEILGVAMVFYIGAKTRNELPVLFVQEEIIRRIGVSNYIEFTNPSRDELKDFVCELLETFIFKGEVPAAHQIVVEREALSSEIPEELGKITGGDPQRLRCFPFEPDAFDEFVEQVSTGDLASKPSEVLVRLQKAALRAMRNDMRTINSRIVQEINTEGF